MSHLDQARAAVTKITDAAETGKTPVMLAAGDRGSHFPRWRSSRASSMLPSITTGSWPMLRTAAISIPVGQPRRDRQLGMARTWSDIGLH